MKLYFRPFAASLAVRIALVEAGLDAEYVLVEPNRPLPDGRPFAVVSPMGYVPAIETPAGFVLNEGPAVLTYVAELAAEGVLAPPPFSDAHYRMLAWLNFVATELHKAVFLPLVGFSSRSGPEERAAAKARVARPFAVLEAHFATREFLEGGFTVADAYLVTTLNWCRPAGIALGGWPNLHAYSARMRRRPAVAAAMAEEMPLLEAA